VTSPRQCGVLRCDLGVYVVDAIAPADRRAVDLHLTECADCRDELAELAELPGLLSSVSVTDALRVAGEGALSHPAGFSERPPDFGLAPLLSRAVRRRRRRRWLIAVAAAAGLIAGAGAVAATRSHVPETAALEPGTTVWAENPQTDASARITYVPRPWGLELYVQVNGIAAGTTCVLDVLSPGGRESVAGSWTVAAGLQDTWYLASTSVRVSGVRGFAVTAGSRTLVQVALRAKPALTGDPR
jgi:hypothetical protein